jgi:alkylation response protein AidB-like acyl-CoA dehydrogenase
MQMTKTAEQAALVAMVREVLATACSPKVVREIKVDATRSSRIDEVYRSLASAGLLGLAIGSEWGGEGASLVELGLFFEEAGRVLCPSSVYETLKFALAVETLADDSQKAAILPAIVRGQRSGVVVIHDPADAADVTTRVRAEPVPEGWLLDGVLDFVPSDDGNGQLLVPAQVEAAAGRSRIVLALVSNRESNVGPDVRRAISGDRFARVDLRGRFVAAEYVVDRRGGVQTEDLTRLAQQFVALQCMEMVGGASAVLERTAAYVALREQFGRPIGSFQAVQHLVADVRIAYDGARLAALQALCRLADGDIATRTVAIAKMQCSEAYKLATLTAHQLHGGMGYVRETDLHLWSERAKVAEVLGGTADVAAGWLADALDLAR